MARKLTLAELKERRPNSMTTAVVNDVEFDVKILSMQEFLDYVNWHESNKETSNLERFIRLIQACCPVFDGTSPEDVLLPNEVMNLGLACRDLNGLGYEEDTAKN